MKALFLFLLLLTPGLADGIPSDSKRILHLHQELSASEFFQREDVKKPIDFSDIDQALLSAAVFHETNRRRAEHDLPALKYLPKLREAALIQARDLRERQVIGHRGSEPDIRTLGDRFEKVGLRPRFRAENVATVFGVRYEAGTKLFTREENGERIFSKKPDGPAIEPHSYRSFAKNLLDAWMDSPGHRKNILHSSPTHLATASLHRPSEKQPDRFYCAQEFYTPLP
ncbi:MAG: hypothetical protein KDN05_10130 [Verrucomicrobiae bacterium]|nr:hypothetical protein [Verrucomicrobiae bacterium]